MAPTYSAVAGIYAGAHRHFRAGGGGVVERAESMGRATHRAESCGGGVGKFPPGKLPTAMAAVGHRLQLRAGAWTGICWSAFGLAEAGGYISALLSDGESGRRGSSSLRTDCRVVADRWVEPHASLPLAAEPELLGHRLARRTLVFPAAHRRSLKAGVNIE